MLRTSYTQWNFNDICFVLDKHSLLDFQSSLEQHSAGRHVGSLGRITLIPSQSVFVLFFLTLRALLRSIKIQLIWSDRGSNPRPASLKASTLSITPPMRFFSSHYILIHSCCNLHQRWYSEWARGVKRQFNDLTININMKPNYRKIRHCQWTRIDGLVYRVWGHFQH